MSTIQTAAREYARRPVDERFPDLPALVAAAQEDKARCGEKTYNCKDLHFVPVISGTSGDKIATREDDPNTQEIQLESPKGRARLTHWSFGQIARDLQTPAAFLRDGIPAVLAADVLNYRLSQTPNGDSMNLLVRAPIGRLDAQLMAPAPTHAQLQPTIRAATGETYGRVWDADLYRQVSALFSQEKDWQLPPTWEGPRQGAYRGDRDSFLILTNGGSIVNDPSLSTSQNGPDGTPGGSMFRGLLIRNSEVGAASVVIETILFRYICGNHMLWGACYDSRFRRRHVGKTTLRDTISKIHEVARKWTTQSVDQDRRLIAGMIEHEIAHTKEAVIDELRKLGATQEQATQAYALCEQRETVSPRTYWGAVQGLTRLSQEQPNQDGRYLLDQLAAAVLARGAKRVMA